MHKHHLGTLRSDRRQLARGHRPLIVLAAVLALAGCGSESPDRILASAKAKLEAQDLAGAAIEIKRAIQAAPQAPEPRLMLGKLLLKQNDPAGAEVELRRARENGAADDEVAPELARAMLLIGQAPKVTAEFGGLQLKDPTAQADLLTSVGSAQAQVGRADEAQATLERAVQAKPGYAPALMAQARLTAAEGKVDEALALLDSILGREPANEHAGIAKAYLLWLGKNDAAAAIEQQRKVLAAHPKSVPARADVATLLFKTGKPAESRREFEELRKIAPQHPSTVFLEAQFAFVDKNYRRSRELTDALLKAAPDDYRSLELAAASEYMLGNDSSAIGFAERALKVAPLTLARQIVAQVHLRGGQPGKAVAVLAPLLEGKNADAESLALAGSAYAQAGDTRRADAAFQRARQLAPGNAAVRTSAALAMLSGGRGDLARSELEAIAAADNGTRADLALISARIEQRDLRGALRAVDTLQKKLPDDPLPHQLRGQLRVSLRDAAGARQSFSDALAKNPRYFPAIAALASLDVVTGKLPAARQRVDAYLKEVPNNADAHILRAELAGAAGVAEPEVLRLLAEAVRTDARSRVAHLALYQRHRRAADLPGALSAIQAAAAALPDDPEVLHALGLSQQSVGDHQQAIATYKRIVALRPADATVQLLLGDAYRAVGDAANAQRAFGKALELAPGTGPAYQGLALLALQDNKPDEAISHARALQRLQPKRPEGFAIEGDLKVRQRDWPSAAAAYRTAYTLAPSAELAIKYHAVLSVSKQRAEADRLAADWERRSPRDPAFQFYLGDAASQRKDYAAAEGHYREVLKRRPNDAMALNNIAWMLLEQKKPGALEFAERANALLPNRAPVLDTLAAAQAAAGRTKEAVATQQRAVTAMPSDPALKLGLARYLVAAGERERAREHLQALQSLGDKFKGQSEVSALLARL